MVIKRTIDKETVKRFAQSRLSGTNTCRTNTLGSGKAVSYLKSCPLLGIDSETRPSFTKGHVHKVALLQILQKNIAFCFASISRD